MSKTRHYIAPSALGSYFGVGFNTPEEQFRLDTGVDKSDFDEEARLRMALGNHLEDAAINFFQDEVFKVPITDRNTEVKWGYDGKIKYVIDGIIHFEEGPMIFENKISNATSGRFTDNLGYHFQIQSYMLCEGLDSAVLAGLYQGKPIYKIIPRDEEMIEDIKTMTDFVVLALQGLIDFYDEFPVDLLSKYSTQTIYEPIEDLSDGTVNYLHKLARLRNQKKTIEDEIKELERLHENDYDLTDGLYEDDVVKVTVSSFERKGGFDIDKFKAMNPDFDLEMYMKPNTTVKLRRITLKDTP